MSEKAKREVVPRYVAGLGKESTINFCYVDGKMFIRAELIEDLIEKWKKAHPLIHLKNSTYYPLYEDLQDLIDKEDKPNE